MALSLERVFVNIKLVDKAGDTTTRRYQVDPATVDIPAAAVGLITAIALISDAEVKGYSITSEYAETAFALPTEECHIEDNALFVGQIDSNPFKMATLKVPCPKPGLTSGIFMADDGQNANVVKMDATGVGSFCAQFETGGAFYISDGEQWEPDLQWGRRIHQKSNKKRSYRIG